MVGRLWLQKNPQCFVRGHPRHGATPNVASFMIGDGEYRAELETAIGVRPRDRIRHPGLAQRVGRTS